MNIQLTRFNALAIAVLALGTGLRAEEAARRKPVKKEVVQSPKARLSARAVRPQQLASTTISEVLAQNVTLAPGTSKQFTANSDFTGADKVNIGFYASSDQDLSATNYLVWWAIPDAANYVVSDYIQGSDFAFLNSGGVVESAFGTDLVIEMRNDGKSPVTISQITLYAVAR